MIYLKTVVTALASIVALFLLTKLMGNRQMSQLSMFDYVNGITIGSIAAEMATSLDASPTLPLIAMAVYALVAVLISFITTKSIKMRRILTGRATVLLNSGKLYRDNLKKTKIDINELQTICRDKGFFSFDEIEAAILEPNGKISILPKSACRPATPADLGLNPTPVVPPVNVILDGTILKDNLKYSGFDEMWLKQELSSLGLTNIGDIALATIDSGTVRAYKKIKGTAKRDMFS